MALHPRARKGYETTRDCGFCKWYSINQKGQWVCTHQPTVERRLQEFEPRLAKWREMESRKAFTDKQRKPGNKR